MSIQATKQSTMSSLPLSHPPVSSKAKDYSDRPTEVTDELDALRTAGIARVLNRHFTETTKQLAKEKAQADAALADLERRRTAAKKKWDTTHVSGSSHLNPYDAMYLELQQKRAECRRKERETMLLYQRYVMKYGKSAKTVPIQPSAIMEGDETDPETNLGGRVGETNVASQEESKVTKGHDPPGDPPGNSTLLGTPVENSTTELNTSRSPRRRGGDGNKKTKRTSNDTTPVKNFMSALNKFMKEPKQEDDENKDDGRVTKQSRSPFRSPLRRGGNKSKEASIDEVEPTSSDIDSNSFELALSGFMNKDDDKANEVDKDETSDTVNNIVPMDASGNLQLEPTSVSTEEGDDEEVERPMTSELDLLEDTIEQTSHVATTNQIDHPDAEDSLEKEIDADIGSVTKVRNVSITESTDKETADEPKQSVSSPVVGVEDGISSFTTPNRTMSTNPAATVTPTVEVTTSTTETPSFATTTIDDEVEIDERSIISGLTSTNSALTRQVLDDVHTEIEVFIKTETEAIRQMLDTESPSSTTGHDQDLHSSSGSGMNVHNESSSSLFGDESVLVAAKAEAMALEMQRILQDFQKDDAESMAERMSHISEADEDTNKDTVLLSGNIDDIVQEEVSANRDDQSATHQTPSKYPYKFEPAIPGEEWYVYYDEKYEREFYLEKKTNVSQWEEPSATNAYGMSDRSVVTADDFMSDMHSVASSRASRRSMSRRSSRRSMYRKKMKKRRRRRLMMSFFALFSVLVCVFHWRVNYPEKSFADAMKATLLNLKSTKSYLIDQFEYTFTDRREREEQEEAQARARKIEEERRLKILKEERARELAAQKAKEEAERRAAEAAERERIRKAKEEAERLAREEEQRRLVAKAAAEAAEAARLKEEEDRRRELQAAYAKHTGKTKENSAENRPIACNIPFAYLVPKCGRLAKSKPLFKPEEIGFLE